MWFKVYSKAQDAGFLRDYYWAPRDEEPTIKDEHGPYPFRFVARLAAFIAWVKGGGSV